MNTLYQLWSSIGGDVVDIAALCALIAVQRRIHHRRHTSHLVKVKRELVRDLEPPKRTVNWQHVADLEREIYRKAYHHEGVPCCCAKCKRKRAPKRYPVQQAKVIELAPKATGKRLVDDLRSQRQAAWMQAKVLCETVAAENRNFTKAEQIHWDNLNQMLDVYDRRIHAIYEAGRRDVPRLTYGDMSYVAVATIGDPQPILLAADPQTQWQMDYDRGRDLGQDIIRRIENDHPAPPAISD